MLAVGLSGPRNVVVKSYDYYMNGSHAGVLFLKQPIRQCPWWSASTGLRTDWHGPWVSYDGVGFVATFDWSGRPSQKHVVIYHNHQGNGYRGLNQTKHLVLGSTSPPSLFGPIKPSSPSPGLHLLAHSGMQPRGLMEGALAKAKIF